jgi:two-component system, chemotaxis family, sensor kinase CheA
MSMSNDELQQLLLATFADQAKEQLQTINERLLALEEAEGDDKGPLLEEIFREAHSLKGASRAVDLGRVEAVAHKLESLFSVIQKGQLEADAEVFDLAYKALDALTALVEEGLSGTGADVDVDGLCNVLTSAAEAGSAEVQSAEVQSAEVQSAEVQSAEAEAPKAEAPAPTPDTQHPTPEPATAGIGGAGPEGARLVALNMALNGTPREEAARYLSDNFQLEDQQAILDDVYSRIGGRT